MSSRTTSIGVGEDGPTHQPVEQLLALRSIPGLITLRPADANEVVEAWRVIIGLQHQPACLALSRQALPTFDRTRYAPAAGLARGAYVLADAPDGKPAVILIGTGSEVALCVDAYEELKREGIPARVVSMPSWELFEQQDQAYRDGVLPPNVTARVSVEMGSVIGWDRYVGATGAKIGMTTFGSSAPLKDLLTKFGFTPAKVACRRERADRKVQRNDMMNVQVKTKSSVNPLKRLHDYGQAVWLDFLARRFIAEGGLKKLIEQDGLTGVTSNPSIFEKAIGGSADYDSSLKAAESDGRLRCHGALRAARDRGHPACGGRAPPGLRRNERQDGYVSLEVSPYLAMNTEATVAEARRLWRAVGRDNLMIKVPATKAGLPAIRQLIGEGINVNITLLFSQQVYEEVVEAYLAGLEHLIAQGGDASKIASVASFFVSRIDVAVDKLIEERLGRDQRCRRAPCARAGFAARSRSPMPSLPINATSGFSPARVGRSFVPRARGCSGCFGQAPAPRTRTTATCSTSRS